MAFLPENPPPRSSAPPGAPASPPPQPRSLTSNTPTHRGNRQRDKQPEELVHGLGRGTTPALGDEWEHALEAVERLWEGGWAGRCLRALPHTAAQGPPGTHQAESCLCPSQACSLEPPATLPREPADTPMPLETQFEGHFGLPSPLSLDVQMSIIRLIISS